jgi:phosphatidate cytidylyltransferase
MIRYLRNLSSTEQVAALFILVFGVLTLASIWQLITSLRERRHEHHGPERDAYLARLQDNTRLLQTTWTMVVVFWIGWTLGNQAATVLFAFVSFFALREFITLSPTHRGDHRGLILVFFVVLPVQYWLVSARHFDLFTVFIPVYVFLAVPVVSALGDDPHRFLERNAKLQWGIMVCVFGMSHVPALLLLEFPRSPNRGAFLVFFLVAVVQTCMLAQHLLARRWPRKPQAPNISTSFNWATWLVGVTLGGLLGGLLSGITPFNPAQGLGMALIACISGSLGHLVMKALKRDRGITSWGAQGLSVTGASGLLDRVDALCFAAPIFFHSVRWIFKL